MKLMLAKEFSPLPFGRFNGDGEYNAQRFREDFLVPRLKDAEKEKDTLDISLDGIEGMSASFLEEAFGGLITVGGYTLPQLKKLLRTVSEEPGLNLYENVLWDLMKEAADKAPDKK